MNAAKSAWVVDVREENWERDVMERSRQVPIVVDFWAPWCGPCRMLGPMLERLAAERQGDFVLAKVNVDHAQELAAMFQIESIPAVKAIRNGQIVLEFEGALPEAALRNFLDRICPSPADREAQHAQQMEASQPAEAEAVYRRLLESDPNQELAQLGLARLLLAQGQDEEVSAWLGKVRSGGEQAAEKERLQSILAVRCRSKELGDEAMVRRKLSADPNNAQLHYELGCILAANGQYAEGLASLLTAAEKDKSLATGQAREMMVQIFSIIGVRSALADEYRDKLTRLLY